jgi:hypothetical protein
MTNAAQARPHRAVILEHLGRGRGRGLTGYELARMTGTTAGSLSKLLRSMERHAQVVATAEWRPGIGRQVSLWRVAPPGTVPPPPVPQPPERLAARRKRDRETQRRRRARLRAAAALEILLRFGAADPAPLVDRFLAGWAPAGLDQSRLEDLRLWWTHGIVWWAGLSLSLGAGSDVDLTGVYAAARHCLDNDDPVSWLSRDAAASS